MRSLRIPLDLRGIGSTDRTGSVSLKPLVYTLGVELVIAGQDPEELARLEVTHAHHTHCLLRLMVVGVEAVRWKLFYICFGQTAGLCLPETLRQVQQGLIVLHLSVIYVQLQIDSGGYIGGHREHGQEVWQEAGVVGGRGHRLLGAVTPAGESTRHKMWIGRWEELLHQGVVVREELEWCGGGQGGGGLVMMVVVVMVCVAEAPAH